MDTWRVHPGPVRAGTIAVEPDLVNAAPFLAAALVTGGTVTIGGWPQQTTQPAGQITGPAHPAGRPCQATAGRAGRDRHRHDRGITADLGDCASWRRSLAALAALADSPSRFTGIGHMRRHETDRLAALATEINALGGEVTELADGLEIRPRPLRGGVFASYDDHRLVMAAAVLGLAVPGIEVAERGHRGQDLPGVHQPVAAMLEGAP